MPFNVNQLMSFNYSALDGNMSDQSVQMGGDRFLNCTTGMGFHFGDPPTGVVFVLRRVLVPCLCVIGMIGNLLTLIILNRKRLKSTCSSTERSVHMGFVALAVSDTLFCVSLLPNGLFAEEPWIFDSLSFQLLYRTYSGAIINAFIMTSTWLTVTMATGRYLAICHPFRCRHFISMRTTKIMIPSVFVSCFLFNIPKMLFNNEIDTIPCQDGKFLYTRNPIIEPTIRSGYTIYMWVYFVFGILIPLAMLAFCNICLMRALHESTNLRRRCGVRGPQLESNHRITPILVIIVVMYIALVTPAEIILFLKDITDVLVGYVLAVEITNVMQCVNFSFNFVLYYVMNIHFRRAMWDTMCFVCRRYGEKNRNGGTSVRLPLKRQATITNTTCTDI